MSEIAFRWSGILLIIGAVLLGAAIVILSLKPVVNQVFSPGVSLLLLISSFLLLLPLPAMYARQADAAGWLGLAGHALLQTGILILVVLAATPILYPSLKTATGENVFCPILPFQNRVDASARFIRSDGFKPCDTDICTK